MIKKIRDYFKTKTVKYLFIKITVQEGEYKHNHKILICTKCKSLAFAAEYYTAHYWGYGTRDFNDNYWWWGDHAGKLEDWTEISKKEYKILNKYI